MSRSAFGVKQNPETKGSFFFCACGTCINNVVTALKQYRLLAGLSGITKHRGINNYIFFFLCTNLGTVIFENDGLDVVRMSFQFHCLGARARVPNANDLK